MSRLRSRRAFVLFIVVSFLSVLSILAVTFTLCTRIERNVSKNYVDAVRAKMLATAGVDDAMLRLRADATKHMYDSASDPWFYAGTYVAGLPRPETPLESADSPSYRAGTITVDGNTRGYSGALAGTYAQLGDTYALKVIDLAGHINVNGHETNLASMLDALGRGIQLIDGKPDPVRGRGAQVVSIRTTQFGGQFKAFDDLLVLFTLDELDILRDYVTIYSWADRGVVEPAPQNPATWPVESYDFRLTALDTGLSPPQPFGRHPVNVNTAPLPVLFACLANLSARIVRGNALVGVPAITDAQAQAVSGAIGAARANAPFTTWEGFESWCNSNLGMISTDQVSVVEANANPNTRLNKFCPDAIGVANGQPYGRTADKTDLTYNSTEFTFSSCGWFQIESLGRVVDPLGRLVASAKLRTVLKLFDVMRHSSQQDFVNAGQGSNGFVGTRSSPENMDDQAWDPSRASAIDGQIQPRVDSEIGDGDLLFSLDSRDSLCSNVGGQWHERWYSNIHDQGRVGARADLCDNRPEDAGQMNVPYNYRVAGVSEQAPLDRTVMNAQLPPSFRNSLWGSDLFPDGHMINRRRNKVNLQPAVDQFTEMPLVDPQHSAFQWWMKQDLRGGPMDGWFCQSLPGSDQPIPAGPGPGADLYGFFFAAPWINGGHCSFITDGVVLPQCRHPKTLKYPFKADYLWLDYNPFGNLVPPPGFWNLVRVELDNYTTVRLYLNGELIHSSTAYWTRATYNATNILDIAEFGFFFLHSYIPDFDWSYGSDCLIDTVRVYGNYGEGRNHPYRYPTTNGGAWFQGAFDFSRTLAPGQTARLLNIGYTQIKPHVVFGEGGYQTITNPPYVALDYLAPGGSWTSAGSVGDGAQIDQPITSGQSLLYRLKFYDNGLVPNNVTACADDVTVFYSTSPQVFSWAFDPN